MIDWTRKLTRRKFWACVGNFVSMLLIMLRVDENSATQAVALIMAGAGVIAYIIGEGLTDAAAAGYEDGPSETQEPEEAEEKPE